MGCTQAKQNKKNKQCNILSYNSDNKQDQRVQSTTPTFNYHIEFELIEYGDNQNYPTFRQNLKYKEIQQENDIKRRSYSDDLVIYELKSNKKLNEEFKNCNMAKSDQTASRIKRKIVLDDIERSSIVKRRRNLNEFQYQI